MKKFILLLGALLFAAVFMSGCVTETDDPIVGIWHFDKTFITPYEQNFESGCLVFNADGTRFTLSRFTGELVSEKLDFTWEKTGDGKYLVTVTDTNGAGVPPAAEAVLEGDTLTVLAPGVSDVHHRESLSDFIPGLWITDMGDYKEYQNIKSMIYFADDGTGNLIVYNSKVMGIADVFTSAFTWEEKDGSIYITGEKKKKQDFVFENGKLLLEGKEAYHKYTIEDHLYGLWMSDKPHVEDGVAYDIVELIRSDGTGVEIWTVPDSHAASYKYTFTWRMDTPHSYKAVYNDSELWEFKSINTKLYDGETWYNKVGFDVLKNYADKVTA